MPDKIGRNDPCPCGSGKKYKKCCLSKYDKHGYHTLLCYVDSWDGWFFDAFQTADSVTLYERGTGRKVVLTNIDRYQQHRLERSYTVAASNKDYKEGVFSPTGRFAFQVCGSIPQWNADEVIVDVSRVIQFINLVRVLSPGDKGGETNGTA